MNEKTIIEIDGRKVPVAKVKRMAKVSKPTATRDLAELEKADIIIAEGAGPTTRYRLNSPLCEPIDGINDGIKCRLDQTIRDYPGRNVPFFATMLSSSRPTIERAIASFVAAGKIEHRGRKKTGGYYPLVDNDESDTHVPRRTRSSLVQRLSSHASLQQNP